MTLPTTIRILIFFARNPRERLSAADLEEKFGMARGSSAWALRDHRALGNLAVEEGRGERGQLVYRIGPALLAEIGGGSVEADAP